MKFDVVKKEDEPEQVFLLVSSFISMHLLFFHLDFAVCIEKYSNANALTKAGSSWCFPCKCCAMRNTRIFTV